MRLLYLYMVRKNISRPGTLYFLIGFIVYVSLSNTLPKKQQQQQKYKTKQNKTKQNKTKQNKTNKKQKKKQQQQQKKTRVWEVLKNLPICVSIQKHMK